jgi:hypothetical protein
MAMKLHTQRKRRARLVRTWVLLGCACLVVAAIIGAFVLQADLQRREALNKLPTLPASTTTSSGTSVTTETQKQLTSLDPALLAQIKNTPAADIMTAIKNTPLARDSNGKPIFLYVGGEFCPYCAGQRWAVIIALSRFGSFGPLQPIISSEGNIPSYTFHNATYTSEYLSAALIEASNGSGQKLDSLSTEQQQWFDKYNAPPYTQTTGSIPFIDIANQRVSTGLYYKQEALELLHGNTHQYIVDQLKDPNSTLAKEILGSANYLTAAICTSTNNLPAAVCQAGPIPDIQKTLPKTALQPRENTPMALDVPRIREKWLVA